MKKLLLLSLALSIGFVSYSQGNHSKITKEQQNFSLKRSINQAIDNPVSLQRAANPFVDKGQKAVTETSIGKTKYDLQTNSATQNRFYRYSDGTMAGAWTRGTSDPNFSDRGTGYNYYDGSSWGAMPTSRIESIRCGWPSLAPLGNGEIIVSHNGTTGLQVATRAAKGTGTWTETVFAGPTGHPDLLWPRMVTSGANHDTIHIIAITPPVANSGTVYHGVDGAILYSRSTDGGTTWGISNVILPGMDSSNYKGFSGDSYAFAEPKGNTIAFVVGDSWYDLFLMKSIDGGTTWTKTVVFQHPFPLWTDSIVTVDTPYVADGSSALAIDNSGKVHVFFGRMRVFNEIAGDDLTSWFPYVDGLLYWNESMSTLTTLKSLDTLDLNGNLISTVPDMDGDGQIMLLSATPPDWPFGVYYLSMTSMPNVVIDNNNDIYLVYSTVMELYENGYQHYRHVLAKKSTNGGATWGNSSDLNMGALHEYDECVFASMAANTDNSLHMIFQCDYEPGLAVRGDEDMYDDNDIFYLNVLKSDIGYLSVNDKLPAIISCNIYPNPVSDNANVSIVLNKSNDLNISITNIVGQEIQRISKGTISAGSHVFNVNTSNLSSGLYFFTVNAGDYTVTKKIVVK